MCIVYRLPGVGWCMYFSTGTTPTIYGFALRLMLFESNKQLFTLVGALYSNSRMEK
jgi:hypothetical protein